MSALTREMSTTTSKVSHRRPMLMELIGKVVLDPEGNIVSKSLTKEANLVWFQGSQAMQHRSQYMGICSNHDDCEARRAQINMTNKLKARELVRGHMTNVVRGLKIYDNMFTAAELSKLTDYVNELRVAGRNGELSGETFLMFNHLPTQQLKDVIKREFIQFGSPLYESATNQKKHLEPIPPALKDVIDHLVQWDLIPDSKKPNGCIINYFDEGEFSQPFLKPPHLEYPVSTLLLSQSKMAFGHNVLVCCNDGNYIGSLMLQLQEGSLLVMRGNSADVASNVMCSSGNKRISITFFRVRMEDANQNIPSLMPSMTGAMTLRQPGVPNGAGSGYEARDLVPRGSVPPMVLSPRSMSHGGTGVFVPCIANNSGRRFSRQ